AVVSGMRDEDVREVVAFLGTVPAVKRANLPKKTLPMFESVLLPAWLAAFAARGTPATAAPRPGWAPRGHAVPLARRPRCRPRGRRAANTRPARSPPAASATRRAP